MAILSSLKNTFLPTSDVARDRRIKYFGTENKYVAAATIGVVSAAAIAAPGVIAGGGIKKAGQAYATSTLKTKVGLFLAAPIIAGRVVKDPKNITKAPAAAINFQKNIYEVAKDPSKENVINLVKENPILSAAAGLIAGYTVGKTGINAYNAFQNSQTSDKIEKNTEAILNFVEDNKKKDTPTLPTITLPQPQTQPIPTSSTLPASPIATTSSTAGSVEPITRQTQVLGKEPSSRKISKRRPKIIQPIKNSVRVNIINQNNYKPGRI